jgi:DNA-binding MarR family transcriptional regulator
MASATDTRKLSHLILTHNKLQLTNKQLAVLEAIVEIGPATNEEVAHHLGWEINRVVGRTFELREFGVVINAGKRRCRITGEIAHTWKVK